MVLIDTSVFVDYLSGNENDGTIKLDGIISENIPFGITPNIYQELLQGVSSERQFISLKEYLNSQRFYYLINGNESYAKAANMYFKLRERGISVRSSNDLLIALTAIENSLLLLHRDRDFNFIQSAFPELIFY